MSKKIPKVVIYPKDSNPYQSLLYENLNKYSVSLIYFNNQLMEKHGYIIGASIFPFRLIYLRFKGYNIFHLHWVYPFVLPIPGFIGKFLSQFYFYFFITLLRILRYKIVWTVHNVLPHEKSFINDGRVASYLSKSSSCLIVHSRNTIEEMRKLQFTINNYKIIPHGNYINAYENKISKVQARTKLNIPSDFFTFLFLGKIRGYKGVEDLLSAFSIVSKNNRKIFLLIIGECKSIEARDEIKKNIRNNSNVIFYPNYIKDNEIQLFLNASDIVVFPFKNITTSGSVMLALSFSKPIIYPKIGSLKDLPSELGIGYDPKNIDQLSNAMKKSIDNKSKISLMGNFSYEYAKKFSWDSIGKKTLELYSEL